MRKKLTNLQKNLCILQSIQINIHELQFFSVSAEVKHDRNLFFSTVPQQNIFISYLYCAFITLCNDSTAASHFGMMVAVDNVSRDKSHHLLL